MRFIRLFFTLFLILLLCGCALADGGRGTVLYVYSEGKTYTPAPSGWIYYGHGRECSAKAGYGRSKYGKKKCRVTVFGDGTFLLFTNGFTGNILLCEAGKTLPEAGKFSVSDTVYILSDGKFTDTGISSADFFGSLVPDESASAACVTEKSDELFVFYPEYECMLSVGRVSSDIDGRCVIYENSTEKYLVSADNRVNNILTKQG